jgi:bifunctional non-homologous end joining protein LigD
MSAFIPPQLLRLVDRPPSGDQWIHEIKHDGYRTQITVGKGRVRAFTRNGHDWTKRYPRLVTDAAALPCRSAVVDGEAVVQDEVGWSDFGALAGAISSEPHRVCLFAFDLLELDGRALRRETLELRRALLRNLLAGQAANFAIHYSEEFDGDGAALFAVADQHGLEGIVSKRRESRYTSRRSDTWVKTNLRHGGHRT